MLGRPQRRAGRALEHDGADPVEDIRPRLAGAVGPGFLAGVLDGPVGELRVPGELAAEIEEDEVALGEAGEIEVGGDLIEVLGLGVAAEPIRPRSSTRRPSPTRYATFAATIPTRAFTPKVAAMKPRSQFHGLATIRTGGAAKWVRVPPTEMFTKSRPIVA